MIFFDFGEEAGVVVVVVEVGGGSWVAREGGGCEGGARLLETVGKGYGVFRVLDGAIGSK